MSSDSARSVVVQGDSPETVPEDDRPSPLQNRVLPTGEIVATRERGLLLGNRGCIHRPDGRLGVTRWRTKMWISCELYWRGRRRDPMPPGRWTALFFLDEVTALAAGHRPCGYCRRADHRWFARSWQAGRREAERPLAWQMDRVLHAERVESRTRRKITRPVRAGDLPDGAMADLTDLPDAGTPGPALLAHGQAWPWTLDGYHPPRPVDPAATVRLLTPPAIVAALAAGYVPLAHPTAAEAGLRPFGSPPLPSAGAEVRP